MTKPGNLAMLLLFLFALSLVHAGGPFAEPSPAKGADLLLTAMQQELRRATTDLGHSDPPPYFLSYSAVDQTLTAIAGTYGSLITSIHLQRRQADVTIRVGSPSLDNTHGESRSSGMSSGALPLGDDADAIARVLWQLTDREYQQASAALLKVKTGTAVRSEEEDKSPDFSEESVQNHADPSNPNLPFDRKEWEERIRRLSARFLKHDDVYASMVGLQAGTAKSYFVSSEGSTVETPHMMCRLILEADSRADDGMELVRVETFQAFGPDKLPSETGLEAKIEQMASDLRALRSAPAAEPFAGPALLSGRAAAVFFHEVLGHRLEGHRQRGENEGQTFTARVNQRVLPTFLSVVDDPTMKELNGTELAGAYDFDDEGVPAARVNAIQDGVLKNFLMSRMPVKNFSHSNGHGRRQAGLMPTGRQGNLMVTSSKTVKDSELRQKLIDEIKKQGKPYGLYFEDIQGGFTLTARAVPQSFQILPVMVWRVYADGRPDQLVRGVDIVGTPLAALDNIILTGDTVQAFNGVCGAESGQIPVAAAAPAMLLSEIEVQKRSHSHTRPPILPMPGSQPAAPPHSSQLSQREARP